VFRRLLNRLSKTDKEFSNTLKKVVGFRPNNTKLYQLALIHSSAAKTDTKGYKHSNERLEYLGDAVLDLIIAEYLFKKYPYKDEGFLTDIRSRIVNRESLNELAKKIGINRIVQYDKRRGKNHTYKSMLGDALEAFIGAVYLDKGYRFTRRFVLKELIESNFDLTRLVEEDPNYKSRIIEWAQKNNHDLQFDIIDIQENNNQKEFTAQITVDQKPVSVGHGLSKKKAEQNAARKSCEVLNIS
jgi:ribonuclease-3